VTRRAGTSSSRDDTVVDSFVQRAEAIGSDAIVVTLDTHLLGWRTRDLDLGYLPFARAQGIARYVSDPAFRRLAEQRAAAAPAVGAAAEPTEPTPRPTLSAVRALASMARHYPGGLWENLRSPVPRAAVVTFLDVFSRPSLTWENLDVYGLALGGSDGARAVMEHIWAELDLTMALSGVADVDQISRDLLA
jgi:lactate 2-monooxygenase